MILKLTVFLLCICLASEKGLGIMQENEEYTTGCLHPSANSILNRSAIYPSPTFKDEKVEAEQVSAICLRSLAHMVPGKIQTQQL